MTTSNSSHSPLLKFLAPSRLAVFQSTTIDTAAALELYVWDRDLSAAFFADIAIIEVAMRHAMHKELIRDFGAAWDMAPQQWDDRTMRKLTDARGRLGSRLTPDRLVAELMFGFWLGLLDEGGRATRPGGSSKVQYESVWRSTLHKAFPGAKVAARTAGAKASRSWVHSHVAMVAALRNRVAHHEPLLNGIPLPGQRDSSGHLLRMITVEAYDACLRVAEMIDRDLAEWLATASTVPHVLSLRPS